MKSSEVHKGREKNVNLVLVHANIYEMSPYAVHTRRMSSVKPRRHKKQTSVVKEAADARESTSTLSLSRARVVVDADNAPISFVLNWYKPTPTATVVARSVQVSTGPRVGNLRLWT
jgi:hypothetical protein